MDIINGPKKMPQSQLTNRLPLVCLALTGRLTDRQMDLLLPTLVLPPICLVPLLPKICFQANLASTHLVIVVVWDS